MTTQFDQDLLIELVEEGVICEFPELDVSLELVEPSGVGSSTGQDGADGREVELGTSSTHVRWRYVGDLSWTNLVLLTDLVGPAGADGQDGAPGAQGPAGDPGADGQDGADLSDTTPQALGTAAAGDGTAASRADHVHGMPTAADVGAAATSHTHTGTQVTVDASGFNGNLTTSDDTLQEVAQKLDDLSVSTGTGGFTRSLMLGGM